MEALTQSIPSSHKQKVVPKKEVIPEEEEEDMDDDHDKKKRTVGGAGAGVANGTLKKGCGGTTGTGGGSGSSMRCCQAERCTADLSDAKQYHKRHKVCELHAKAQVVIVAGNRQRFCQQCSRLVR